MIDPNAKKGDDKRYKVKRDFFERIDEDEINEQSMNSNIDIFSSHTIEHIVDPGKLFDFASRIKKLRNMYIQFPCLELMVESSRYDLVHNQHLHYFSLKSIEKLASRFNFKIQDFELDRDHYGTLRVVLSKGKSEEALDKYKSIKTETIQKGVGLFSEVMKQGNDIVERLPNLYCFGAALMLPIIYYYYPTLNSKAKAILDNDKTKSEFYVGIDTPITYDDGLTLESKSIVITAIATRAAHRAIVTNIIKRDAMNIYNPVINF